MDTDTLSPSAWRDSGAHFDWHGQSIFVRAQGSGPALLLLHGFPTSSWDFRHVWDELARDHRVIALDYLGFGFSDKPRGYPYSVFGYADQAEAALAHLGVDHAHVLAHDLGVSVACELMARDQLRRANGRAGTIRSVCFLNGGIYPEQHRPRLIQRALHSPLGPLVSRLVTRPAFERAMRGVFGPHTQPSRDELDGYWTCANTSHGLANYHRLIRYMSERRAHRDRWVGAIERAGDIPFGFVNGLLDPVSGAHLVQAVRARLPHVKIHALDRVGHYPQVEDPRAVLDAYRALRADWNAIA